MPDGWITFWKEGGDKDCQSFENLIQFWEAYKERLKCIGTERWPRMSVSWYTGTIDTASADNNARDSFSIKAVDADWEGSGDNPWLTPDEDTGAIVPWAPSTWRVAVEWSVDDYRHYLVSDILSWTTDTLQVSSFRDFLTAKEFTLDDLAGKRFVIIRGGYGIVWQERWPECPQAEEHTKGIITAVSTGTSESTDDEPDGHPITLFKDETKNWALNKFVATDDDPTEYEIVYRDDKGVMRRSPVESNTENQIVIATPEFPISPDGPNEGRFLSVDGLVPGTTYAFRVFDASRDSESFTTTAVTTGDPVDPGGTPPASTAAHQNAFALSLTVVGDRTIELRWNSTGPLAEYHVLMSTSGGAFTEVSKSGIITGAGSYAVIVKDKVYRLDRLKWLPYCWYRGKTESAYAHSPLDDLGTIQIPKGSVTYLTGESPDCEEQSFPLFDIDHWSGDTETCSAADKPYAGLHLFKTIRALQNEILSIVPQFLERKSWHGESWVSNFVLATFFAAAGINSQEGSTTTLIEPDVMGMTGITLPANHPLPISAVFAIIDDHPNEQESGTDVHISGIKMSGILNITDPTRLEFGGVNENLEGMRVVISFGWTRYKPRGFRYFYPTQFFIPDLVPTEDGGVEVVDPARVVNWEKSGTDGIGLWSRREASDKYVVHGGFDPGDDEPFVIGELARWVGNNDSDPISPLDVARDGQNPLTYYHDIPNVMKRSPVTQSAIDVQKSGQATGGSLYRLVDSTKNWVSGTWYGGGYGHVETGTATSGSTSSLQDSSKVVGTESGAFWDASVKFPLFSGPYVDFIIEFLLPTQVPVLDGEGNPTFDDDGNPVTEIQDVWHKRPIATASISAGGISVTWVEPTHVSVSSHTWRIREPKYELNRWQKRTLKVNQVFIDEDGTSTPQTFEVVIVHSDSDTLFFDAAPYPVLEGAKYQIVEADIGSVYRWNGTSWEAPDPAVDVDIVRTGVESPQPFRSALRNNLPTIAKRYGALMKGDYVGYDEFWDQLYRALNALVWTQTNHFWHARGDAAVPEANEIASQSSFASVDKSSAIEWNDIALAGGGEWTPPPSPDGSTHPPIIVHSAGPYEVEFIEFVTIPAAPISYNITLEQRSTSVDGTATSHIYSESLLRLTGHGVVQGINTLLPCKTEFLTHNEIFILKFFGGFFTHLVPEDDGVLDSIETGPPTGPFRRYHFRPHAAPVTLKKWASWTSGPVEQVADRRTAATFFDLRASRPPTAEWVEPPAPDPGTTISRSSYDGFQVDNQTCILKWNVEGGLKYVDVVET